VIGFMALLDVTIVNVALPSIRSGLDASTASVQWIVSGYALAFGLTLVAGGRLGDALGRRRMMLIGLTGFLLSSAAVGLAPDEAWAVVARLAQGASAGLLTPQNSGLIQQLFRGAERGRAFGFFGLTVSVSAALGPVLGGLIIAALGEEHGWRAIFLVNVPIGLVALVFVARMVPGRDPVGQRARADIDVVGAAILGAAVLAVLFPLVAVMADGAWVLLVLLAAPVLFWLFVHWERRVVARGRAPLLDVQLLTVAPGYAWGILLGTLYFTGFTGTFLVLSVHLQESLGLSPLAAGLMITPFAVGSAVTAPVAGHYVSHVGRRVTVTALCLVLAGLTVVTAVVPGHDGAGLWPLLVLPLLLAGLGGGGVVSPNFTLTLSDVPPRMGGAAGGALQTGQRIGSALGTALAMSVYQVTVGATGSTGSGLRVALGTSLVVIALALAVAVRDLRAARQRTENDRAPEGDAGSTSTRSTRA
jgi:EmrB/QacA subfamily drug resistance transporter